LLAEVSHMITISKKFRGLMLRKNSTDNKGYLFLGSSVIHTFFMLFSIDVVYLKRINSFEARVVKIVRSLRPWRVSGALGADGLIEFKSPASVLDKIDINDVLQFE
ncbi:MAG: hypothetical protein GX817_03075, partial [Elusimicrobia bacterium]|nr:hypothetical protein [Elusimicrobiota bacterium]